MKKITQTSILSLALILLLGSCQQECDCSKVAQEAESTTRNVDAPKSFRQSLVGSMAGQLSSLGEVSRFALSDKTLPKGIEPQHLDVFTKGVAASKSEALANVEATELVTSIFNALIGAENTQNQLDVKFSMSDIPVDNGSFIFGIETTSAQNLILTMYDEEGFGVVANNRITLKEGNNYKALKVSDLEPGGYIFKLKNEKDGKELVRRVEIAQ